ncbi:PsbP-related protein [Phosphitispora sp. TUW77]|uniref:PsbP-related protein n=1 Tax=Phosphitispora sp. TUW77 TaxID=3152361 RepID=UPI003AB2A087
MKRSLVILVKRRLIWTVIVFVGVMCPLLAVSYYIPTADVAGDAANMLIYSSDSEGFSFSYPRNWVLRTERDYSSEAIIENVTFESPDKKAYGLMQVMKMSGTVPEYVLKYQKKMVPGYDSLSFRQEMKGDKQYFILGYSRGSGAARLDAEEYFFQNGEKVYRFSFFYPEAQQKQYAGLVHTMLESLTL